jgi:hypothetical protein
MGRKSKKEQKEDERRERERLASKERRDKKVRI